MKKIIIAVFLLAAVLIVAAVVGISLMINRLAHKGVEAYGPKITQVGVKLSSMSVSVLSGKGRIKGLEIANPPGYKTPSAITVSDASITLKPRSVFSDTVHIQSLRIQDPVITLEGNLKGNNLSQIVDNINQYTASESDAKSKEDKPDTKILMDDLVISGGKVNLSLTMLGGRAATVPLPDIHLTDLGKNSGGLTAGELTQKIVVAILNGATKAMSASIANLGQGTTDTIKNLGQGAANEVQKATKKIGDIFKK